MPEPFVPKDGEADQGKQDNDAVTDAFGSENGDTQPPKSDEGDKGKEGEDKEPTLAELKAQLIEANQKIASMGGNLSGQRTIITNLENKIKEFEKGSGKSGADTDVSHLPFDPKTIVFSKDLPKDQLEEMTDNEIKLHDELMHNRQVMNKQAQDAFDAKSSAENQKVDDLNMLVRSTAKSLANGDEDLANEIIESAKQFNLTGLTADDVKERVEKAYKLLPTYKPPKEPQTKRGGAVKTGSDDKSDPFGTTKIIEEVASKRSGKTFNL